VFGNEVGDMLACRYLTGGNSLIQLVPGVGIEPTRPLRDPGF